MVRRKQNGAAASGLNNRKIVKTTARRTGDGTHFSRSLSVPRVRPSFGPTTIRRTLRYATGVLNVTSAGALGITYFRAIGMFDPTFAVGGHQPMGFDQYMAMYQKYTVLGSRITFDFVVQAVPQAVGIQLVKGTATTYTDYAQITENAMAVVKIIPAVQSTQQSVTLQQLTSRSFGDVNVLDDPELSGTVSTDPTDPLLFAIFNQDINSTSIATVQGLAVIEYDVLFSTPLQLAPS
jgi:hypothetical protein